MRDSPAFRRPLAYATVLLCVGDRPSLLWTALTCAISHSGSGLMAELQTIHHSKEKPPANRQPFFPWREFVLIFVPVEIEIEIRNFRHFYFFLDDLFDSYRRICGLCIANVIGIDMKDPKLDDVRR